MQQQIGVVTYTVLTVKPFSLTVISCVVFVTLVTVLDTVVCVTSIAAAEYSRTNSYADFGTTCVTNSDTTCVTVTDYTSAGVYSQTALINTHHQKELHTRLYQ